MRTKHDLLDHLPELPVAAFEVGGELGPSDRGPFLTIRPHPQPAPSPPTGGAIAAPNKSSASVRKYYTQAIYPRVVCYDPGDLLVNATTMARPAPEETHEPLRDVAALARKERSYKLSVLKGRTLKDPF